MLRGIRLSSLLDFLRFRRQSLGQFAPTIPEQAMDALKFVRRIEHASDLDQLPALTCAADNTD
jgi:hypothetical protein